MSFQIPDNRPRVQLTKAQGLLIARLRNGGQFVSGADVRTARSLEDLRLVRLTDNGQVVTIANKRVDGERWFAELAPDAPVPTPIEHDAYARVWTLGEDNARKFFGQPSTAKVVVLEDRPTDPRDVARYRPEAKLYGVVITRDA